MKKSSNMFLRYAISFDCSLILYWVTMFVGNNRGIAMDNDIVEESVRRSIEDSMTLLAALVIFSLLVATVTSLLTIFKTDASKRAIGIGMLLVAFVHAYLAFKLLDGFNFFANFKDTIFGFWL